MPPHDHYVELFAGHAAIARHKRPAPRHTWLVEIDPQVERQLRSLLAINPMPNTTIMLADAQRYIEECAYDFKQPDTLVYADPPYLAETRTKQDIYEHEFNTPIQHYSLLQQLKRMKCMVMISGYWSQLYADELADWRVVKFNAGTRGGVRTECLWMNFPAPPMIHDPRWVGVDRRHRERLRRRAGRLRRMLAGFTNHERQYILSQILPPSMATEDPNG